MSPQEAFDEHRAAGLQTVGTWSVTVGESHSVEACVIDDSKLPDSPRAHASIDFSGLDTRRINMSAAVRLADLAHQRGRLYPLGGV